MGRFHYTINGEIPFTAEEEAEADAREIEAKAEFEAYMALEYQRQRAAEYPPIGDQLDALFHAGVFPAEMAAKIQAVKDAYLKPE